MIAFHYGKKEYLVPGSYNELSGKQVIDIAGLFVKGYKEDEAVFHALRILINKSATAYAIIPADAKVRMMEHISWVFVKNKLTDQLLPYYEGFAGPKKEFENLTLGEFHFAEVFYRQMTAGKDDTALNKLVAVLYRKPKPNYNYELDSDGDVRQSFNANEIDYYARIINLWPLDAKLAILFFYDGCRQNLLEEYDEIFQGDAGQDNEAGMFDVIRGLSGPVYGPIEKVEVLNVHTALSELLQQKAEADKLKQQQPAA